MLAPEPWVNIRDAVHVEIAALRQDNSAPFCHIVRRGGEALLQFAEEPLLHGTVVVAVPGERGDEAHGGKSRS